MSFYDAIRVGASGAADFEVQRSLRFNEPDSPHLERTPSSTSSRTTWTLSFWVKRAKLGVTQGLFCVNGSDNETLTEFMFASGNNLIWSASSKEYWRTTRVFRDTSAWYHIVIVCDTTNSTQADRQPLYINGVRETDFSTQNLTGSGTEFGFNRTVAHQIGRRGGGSDNFDGYMAEINFIDGQALTPSSFAETDATTGQYIPIDTSGLTFGTNGYRLKFADNSGTSATTLGKDSSGNGNNYTPSNFVTGDAVKDSPTNNFATAQMMGTPFESGASFAEGNLQLTSGSTSSARNLNRSAFAPMLVNSGKWYAEFMPKSSSSGFIGVGPYQQLSPTVNNTRYAYVRRSDGKAVYRTAGSETIATYGSAIAQNDVVGVYLDMDAGTPVVYFSKNGQWADGSGNFDESSPTSGITLGDTFFTTDTGNSGFAAFIFSSADGGTSVTIHANFGQDSTFAGQISAGGNVDANGIGDFKYAVPTGAKALCSANLPDPTILFPNKHFDTLLYTGTGSTQSITGLNFQPDWVWLKSRSQSHNHGVIDSVRGRAAIMFPNSSSAEMTSTATQDLVSFDAPTSGNNGGITVGTVNNLSASNDNGTTIVGWNWNAGDTDSATYTVKVVSDSGNKYRFNDFGTSAVTLDLAEGGTYTFDGSDSSMSSHPFVIGTAANGSEYSTGVTYQLDGASVTYSQYTSGYSSATTRKLIITVPASAPQLYYWCSVHSGMGGAINTNTTLGSSNFDGGIQSTVKANTTSGFSIVTYTGNGSAGATVGHGLGVVPRIVIVKRRNSGDDWRINIGPILGSGKEGHSVKWNSTGGEADTNSLFNSTDPTSSVFTIGNDADVNSNGSTYLAYCFSDVTSYSKFDKYRGNGNDNGTFVFTGFRPAWLLMKNVSSGSTNFILKTAKIQTHNVMQAALQSNRPDAEQSSLSSVDFLSNGFKIRNNGSFTNTSGDTYIYWCFAEAPFKNSRAR